MGIESAERNRALEIIQSIAYSKSEALCKENVKLLQNAKLNTVIETTSWETGTSLRNNGRYIIKIRHLILAKLLTID